MCNKGVVTFCVGLIFIIPVIIILCIGGAGSFLLVDIDSSTILPLGMVDTDTACRHPGYPDTVVGGPHQCGG